MTETYQNDTIALLDDDYIIIDQELEYEAIEHAREYNN